MTRQDSRRGILIRTVRWLAFGALVGGIGALVARRRPPAAGESCSNEGLCRGCAAYPACGLPAAASMRRVLAGEGRE